MARRASSSVNSGPTRGKGETNQDSKKGKCTTAGAGAATKSAGGLGTSVNRARAGPVDNSSLSGAAHTEEAPTAARPVGAKPVTQPREDAAKLGMPDTEDR